ncbi:MAG: C4-dicarboxylate transporter DctA [Cytophagales bacterium]|nr:C4-dicarboxylate transporter DctA [Cytophagales bacterium]
MPALFKNLTFQVLVSIALGLLLGAMSPEWGMNMKILSDVFFKFVKLLIPFIIFFSVVNGIGSIGNLKKLGSVGGKALLYFEIVTTFALIIGVVIANVFEPGTGVDFSAISKGDISNYVTEKKEIDWLDFLMHNLPANAVKAFAEGEVVQILIFAVFFGIGVTKLREGGSQIINIFDKILHVFFNILNMLMYMAPLAAFGAMAYAVGKFGLQSVVPLAKLMLTFYTTVIVFVIVILGSISWYCRYNIFKFLVYIKDELLIVLGTSSSETVLNRIMHKLENLGCSRSVTRLVIPTGYSFNLDGSTIYLSMATLFIAQAYNIPLSLYEQLTIIFILMVTSKGAAAVHGSAIVILAGTLQATHVVPVEGVALLLGIDRFMSEARSITNLIGNGVATMFIAKIEGELDSHKMNEVLG